MEKHIKYEISGHALAQGFTKNGEIIRLIERTESYEGDDLGELVKRIKHDFIIGTIDGGVEGRGAEFACARLKVNQISEIEFEGKTYSREDELSEIELGDGELLETELSKEAIEQYEDDHLWDV